MTDLKELADKIEALAKRAMTYPYAFEDIGSACVDNLPTILSSLRRVGELELTLENIVTLSEPTIRIERPRVNLDAVNTIARSALQPQGGEG